MKKLFILIFILISMMMCTFTVHSEVNNNNNNEILVANTDANMMLDAERFVMITDEIIRAVEEERAIIQEQINIKQAEIDSINSSNSRKNNVTFNLYDVTQLSGITGEELYNVLINFNGGLLAEFAWVFVDCEKIYNVNAFFIAALVAHESGWGKSDRTNYQNNLTGYAVYSDSAEGTTFSSKEECIYETAKLLRRYYLNSDGLYYNGLSVRGVNTKYCLSKDRKTTDYNWSDNISSIANDFNQYYHDNVKRLVKVPTMDINMDELLNNKRNELISQIRPRRYTVVK